jgi:ABC-type multidrug transport system fused ATPase/permease subunit
MENIWIHLATAISIIVILWIAVFLPWVVGLIIGRMMGEPGKNPILTWIFGAFSTLVIMGIAFFFYLMYTDIFTYYTKP